MLTVDFDRLGVGAGMLAALHAVTVGTLSKPVGESIASKILGFRDGLNALSSKRDFGVVALISLAMWGMIGFAYVQTAHAFASGSEVVRAVGRQVSPTIRVGTTAATRTSQPPGAVHRGIHHRTSRAASSPAVGEDKRIRRCAILAALGSTRPTLQPHTGSRHDR